MSVICCCDTLTERSNSVCTSRNAYGLIVVVSLAVLDAGAFVSVILGVRHGDGIDVFDFLISSKNREEY